MNGQSPGGEYYNITGRIFVPPWSFPPHGDPSTSLHSWFDFSPFCTCAPCPYCAGFVHQFEDLLPFLTVREHLVWQATARMSRSNSKHTIMKRVEEVRPRRPCLRIVAFLACDTRADRACPRVSPRTSQCPYHGPSLLTCAGDP